MSSIDEFSAAIGAAAESVESVSSAIGAAKSSGDELAGVFAGLGAEGKTEATNAVGQRLETEAAVMAAQLKDLLDQIREQAEGLRGLAGAPGAGSGSPAQPASGESSPGLPAHVQRLSERLPVWEEDEPTRALVYSDEDGVESEFTSGRDRANKAGLKAEYASRWVMDHAEARLAAAMRQPNGPQRVTMVINKEPCPGIKGCDATLPDIIPPGSTVTVYLRSSTGTSWYREYNGNGKGIAS